MNRQWSSVGTLGRLLGGLLVAMFLWQSWAPTGDEASPEIAYDHRGAAIPTAAAVAGSNHCHGSCGSGEHWHALGTLLAGVSVSAHGPHCRIAQLPGRPADRPPVRPPRV